MSYLRLSLLLTALITLTSISFAQLPEYVVKPGDTLWELAARFDTTTDAILATNGLTGTDLFPGAVLKLPAGSNAAPQTYTVQAGDTLYDIALAFGISVDSLIAFNNIDGSTIKPGQQLQLSVSATTPPAPLTVTVVAGDTLWSLARANETRPELIQSANNLVGETIKPGQTLVIPGRYAAVSEADVGGPVVATVRVAAGDTLWTIARRHNTSIAALMSANDMTSETIRVGQTLKVLPGNELGPAITELVPESVPGSSVNGVIIWPLHGEITSRFGYRRLRVGGSNMHTGLDIDGHTGDPIVAATSGIVTFSGWRSGYGNLVIVTNGDTEYYYAHASELLVTEGEVVGMGQLLALVGSTGNSTGSHLHFEVRVNNSPMDPLQILEQYASH